METFTGLKTLQSFAPTWGDPQLLEKTLVGRRDLVDRLTELAMDGAEGKTLYQQLIIGARGSGKTHIIRVLHNRLWAMEKLREKLVIIYLLEDELGVATFLDFLMRLLAAIQRWSPPDPERDRAIDEIRDIPLRLQEHRAINLLLELLDGRKALILIENLGVMFDKKAGFGRRGQQALRDLVQQHRQFMIFATSQALVEGASDRDAPFYRFFDITCLSPLNREGAMDFLGAIAGAYEKQEVVEFLRSPEGQGRMSAIFEFTGGNHRLLVTFYNCLTARSMVRLSESFMEGLNPLRAYYQEQMRSLSAQQQKIVQFLALQRAPCSVKEIARGCMAAQNVISSQLKDLADRHFLSRHPRGRESFYELTEALFRIVYQADLEQAGAPIRLFVDFLGNFYTAKELVRRHRGYTLLGCRFGNLESTPFLDEAAFYARAIATYYPEAIESCIVQPTRERIPTGEIRTFFEDLRRESAYRDIAHFAGFLEGEHDAGVLHDSAYAYYQLGQRRPAVEMARRALQEAPNDVEALLVLAEVLVSQQETRDEACQYARQSLSLNPRNPEVRERGGKVLLEASVNAEALGHFEELTRLRADYPIGWWLKGQTLSLLGQYDKAITALQQVLALDNRSSDTYEILGLLNTMSGDSTAALENFESLTQLRAAYTTGWWLKGSALESLGRFGEAEAAYRQALALDSEHFNAHEQLGILRGIAGAYGEALEYFETLTRLRADYPTGWWLKGQALKNLGRREEAEAAYRQALTLDAEHAEAHEQLGILRFNAGAHREALGHFETLARLRAEYPNGWWLKGRALESLGRHDEAEAAYRQGLALDAEHAEAHEHMGIIRSNAGAYDEALEHFETLTRLRADYPTGWWLKGQALKNLGRRDEAEAAYRQALALDAEHVNAHEQLGILRGNAGAYDDALEHFEALTRLRADYPTGWWLKGRALEKLGRHDEAEAAYRQTLALDAEHAEAHEQLGILHGNAGAHDEALEHFETLARLRADYPTGWWLKGRALEHLNRHGEAEAAYRQALTLEPKNPTLWSQLAKVYEVLSKTQESENAFNNAIEFSTGSTKAQILNTRGENRRLRNDFEAALSDYRAALTVDPEQVWPRFNIVTVLLALGDLPGALDEYPRALASAFREKGINEGLIVQSLAENWETMFVHGHITQWSQFLKSSLQLLVERNALHYAERALPLTVFALLRHFETISTDRIEQVTKHLRQDVAPFLDVSVAERFLQVGTAHFKEHDPKALLRLPLEERRVFAGELGLAQE